MDAITSALKNHYASVFAEHGATARGVDWGAEEDVSLRYDKMLAVLDGDHTALGESEKRAVSMLDVGCGYGGLYKHAENRGTTLDYTGIDVVPEMIAHACATHSSATFECRDVFDVPLTRTFDYVVCNGILTQKLKASIREMDEYAQSLITRLYSLCRRGAAFNVMTSKVNFTAPNLYYRSPVEMLAFCMSDLTDKIRLDHSYRLYDYTVYLFRS